MKAQTIAALGADRGAGGVRLGLVAWATAGTLWLAPACVLAADASGAASAAKSPPVALETIPGSTIPRVILSAKAAERLGITTARVGEDVVVRKQMVSGLIIPPMDEPPQARPGAGGFGGFGSAAAIPAPQQNAAAMAGQARQGAGGFAGYARTTAAVQAPQPDASPTAAPVRDEVWVLVTLSPGEWERLAKEKPARLLPLQTRDNSGKELWAKPSGLLPQEDMKRSMLSVYYVVDGKDHGLAVNNRMRVELQLAGSEEKQKVVPYSAVYYDAKGNAWAYVQTAALAFERKRIEVERVVGAQALLSAGPAVGTPIVTVGAPLLYGAEIYKK